MKDFFLDIFEYHHYFNQKLADQLLEHHQILPEQTIPLFSHTINAHVIWNARLSYGTGINLNEVHTLQVCKAMDNNNFELTTRIIENSDMNRVIDYHTSRGDAYSNTVQEILFHLANHTTHHRGQIIAQLRQIGVNPIITDYVYYKR